MKGIDLQLTSDRVRVDPNNGGTVSVEIDNVSISELLSQLTTAQIVEYVGWSELVDEMSKQDVIKYLEDEK